MPWQKTELPKVTSPLSNCRYLMRMRTSFSQPRSLFSNQATPHVLAPREQSFCTPAPSPTFDIRSSSTSGRASANDRCISSLPVSDQSLFPMQALVGQAFVHARHDLGSLASSTGAAFQGQRVPPGATRTFLGFLSGTGHRFRWSAQIREIRL